LHITNIYQIDFHIPEHKKGRRIIQWYKYNEHNSKEMFMPHFIQKLKNTDRLRSSQSQMFGGECWYLIPTRISSCDLITFKNLECE